jgi:glycolate oxidase FAD binding subunit
VIATSNLPLTETLTPADQGELAAMVANAAAARTPVYPLGGGTSLDYGLMPKQPGIGLSLAALNRVVDYPARDMTITVEAGITLAELARVLDTERQWLPIEVPAPDRATLGGVIATDWSGPRRYGWGTPRDYVIGVSAVDGRGTPFKGGGRVVKNVAGYDFCKLLTGSLGTLGVITQLTLKIKPQPTTSAIAHCRLTNWGLAEPLLAGLVNSATTPVAIELLAGPVWKNNPLVDGPGVASLLVGFDGSAAEVEWLLPELLAEWRKQGVLSGQAIVAEQARELWTELAEFPAAELPAGGAAPLVIKASVRPSAVVDFVRLVLSIDSQASVQAHAGTGIVIARFAEFPPALVSLALIGKLQPAAVAAGGHAVVLSSAFAADLTRQAVWGGVDEATHWMIKVKQQFDPYGLLNPGRFIYGRA